MKSSSKRAREKDLFREEVRGLFLTAIEQNAPHVLENLYDSVLPSYDITTSGEPPLYVWARDHCLTLNNKPPDWIWGAACQTLEFWYRIRPSRPPFWKWLWLHDRTIGGAYEITALRVGDRLAQEIPEEDKETLRLLSQPDEMAELRERFPGAVRPLDHWWEEEKGRCLGPRDHRRRLTAAHIRWAVLFQCCNKPIADIMNLDEDATQLNEQAVRNGITRILKLVGLDRHPRYPSGRRARPT